jgi:hypothetical protein
MLVIHYCSDPRLSFVWSSVMARLHLVSHLLRHNINIPIPALLLSPRRPSSPRSRRSTQQIINTRHASHTTSRSSRWSTRRRTRWQRHPGRWRSRARRSRRSTRWQRRSLHRTAYWWSSRGTHWRSCSRWRRLCLRRFCSTRRFLWRRVWIDPSLCFRVIVQRQFLAQLPFVDYWRRLLLAGERVGGSFRAAEPAT